jgi:hypothetical protein
MPLLNRSVSQAIRHPIVAALGQGALGAGLSIYGNLANENDRVKGDSRLILETALAGLGAAALGGGVRHLANKHSPAITGKVMGHVKAKAPKAYANIQQNYRNNRLVGGLEPSAVASAVASSIAAGIGAGIGGGSVAPVLADQASLALLPGSWTKRANEWNWDRQMAQNEEANRFLNEKLDQIIAMQHRQILA